MKKIKIQRIQILDSHFVYYSQIRTRYYSFLQCRGCLTLNAESSYKIQLKVTASQVIGTRNLVHIYNRKQTKNRTNPIQCIHSINIHFSCILLQVFRTGIHYVEQTFTPVYFLFWGRLIPIYFLRRQKQERKQKSVLCLLT